MDTHHDGKRAWFTSDPVFQAGYAKGLEDAARVAEEFWTSPRFDEFDFPSDAIRALSRLPVPSAVRIPHAEAAAQSPVSKAAPADEPPQTARLPGLRDQPIEW